MQRVLIIAGSDPSGGAGIQADIKTVTCLSAYAMTAITALTVQNTLGVSDVLSIDSEFVRAQIAACLGDIGADCIKTGMLGDETLIKVVAQELSQFSGVRVIDPVMVAKGGHNLLEPEAVGMFRSQLLPLADILTPNAPEAEVLTGLPLKSPEDMPHIAEALLKMGPKAVLLKGGHLEGSTVIDHLFWEGGDRRYESPRIETRNTHGTGCTLASAIAALKTPERDWPTTVFMARDYVMAGIFLSSGLGQGHGPLRHNWML